MKRLHLSRLKTLPNYLFEPPPLLWHLLIHVHFYPIPPPSKDCYSPTMTLDFTNIFFHKLFTLYPLNIAKSPLCTVSPCYLWGSCTEPCNK